jgi:RNA recognition motif-containing protein
MSSSSDIGAALLPHPNIFVKPLPFGCDENLLREHFGYYGKLCSVRVCVTPSATGVQTAHAFVRFMDCQGAYMTLKDQNRSAVILGQRVTVKLADADMTPKLQSGQCESEWVYIRGLPPGYPADEVVNMFSQFGQIVDMKYFRSTAQYKGTGVLLKYSSIEQAKHAIMGMNEASFPGCVQPLIVRFADSPTEKAAKMTRKDMKGKHGNVAQLQNQAVIQLAEKMLQLQTSNSMPLPPLHHHASSPLQSRASAPYQMQSHGSGPILSHMHHPSAHLVPIHGHAITVSGLPRNCDKLWIYENFSRFGGIISVNIQIDSTRSSNTSENGVVDDSWLGIGGRELATILFADRDAAIAAKESLHGREISGSILQIQYEYEEPIHQEMKAPLPLLSPYSSDFSDMMLEHLQKYGTS